MEGTAQPHVFTLHTLADAENIKSFLAKRRPRRGVVIGAGYIGLEAADVLRRKGVRVTVFEQGAHVLGRDDGDLSDFLRGHLARFGVELRTNARARAIGEDCVEDVPADIVVLAPGLRPNVELATEAGVEIGPTGAIRVDDRMMTNLSGVFAAGDCVQTTQLITGRPAYIPLGSTANKMGRVAGANAAGVRERFPGVVGTSIVKVCGLGIGMTGLSALQARREGLSPVTARIEAYGRPRYFWGTRTSVELVADRQSGRLLGGTVIGEEGAGGRINVIAAALHNRMRVDDFEQLDLAYAPPFSPVWDPLLICAQQLMKNL
jgi:NADPH-dependent 2,4-dienoyl-CoA reductase/sulfur reductase-like enzyme